MLVLITSITMIRAWLIIILCVLTSTRGSSVPIDGRRDIHSFYSRPDILAPRLTTHFANESQLSNGFFFISPWKRRGLDAGPYIYDSSGDLVWSGAGLFGSGNIHNFHVCNYLGKPHLCFFEGRQLPRYAAGHNVILDSSYKSAAICQTGRGRQPADMHEFRIINGSKALVSFYDATPWDLAAQNISKGLGWILTSGFQEIDVQSGEILFDWNALDYVEPAESQARLEYPGLKKDFAWDYFHLNSVDKDANGDYLVSGRHINALLKISGKDGSILWRLGGGNSSFTLDDDLALGFQHHAQLQQVDEHTTTISLFNNGWDGRSDTIFNISYGALIQLDHRTMTAKLSRRYDATAELLSPNQGSIEVIPGSSNVLVGWGHDAYLTEHLENGQMVLNMSIAGGHTVNYRAFKANWMGAPTDSPSTWSYAKAGSSATVLYASWNGATEVVGWRAYAGQSPQAVDLIDTFAKQGFETRFVLPQYYPYTFVEAVSASGISLGNSTVRATFTPGEVVAAHCTDDGCPISLTPTLSARWQGNCDASQNITGNISHPSMPQLPIPPDARGSGSSGWSLHTPLLLCVAFASIAINILQLTGRRTPTRIRLPLMMKMT